MLHNLIVAIFFIYFCKLKKFACQFAVEGNLTTCKRLHRRREPCCLSRLGMRVKLNAICHQRCSIKSAYRVQRAVDPFSIKIKSRKQNNKKKGRRVDFFLLTFHSFIHDNCITVSVRLAIKSINEMWKMFRAFPARARLQLQLLYYLTDLIFNYVSF